MRVVQTTNKKLVFSILLSALVVGVMLTIGFRRRQSRDRFPWMALTPCGKASLV